MQIETHNTHFGPQYHANIYVTTDVMLSILKGESSKYEILDRFNCISNITFFANTYVVFKIKAMVDKPPADVIDTTLTDVYLTLHFCHLELLKYLWDTFDNNELHKGIRWYMTKNKNCMDQYHYSYYPHRILSEETKAWFMGIILGEKNDD